MEVKCSTARKGLSTSRFIFIAATFFLLLSSLPDNFVPRQNELCPIPDYKARLSHIPLLKRCATVGDGFPSTCHWEGPQSSSPKKYPEILLNKIRIGTGLGAHRRNCIADTPRYPFWRASRNSAGNRLPLISKRCLSRKRSFYALSVLLL